MREDGNGMEDCAPKRTTAAGVGDVEDVYAPAVAMTFTKALDVPSAGMDRGVSHVLLRACLYVEVGDVYVMGCTAVACFVA